MSVVVPRPLPAPLRALAELALDLRWTWSHGDDALWQRLDAELWEQTGNPWLMLQLVPAARLHELATDGPFLGALRAAAEGRRAALASPGWCRRAHGEALEMVAYFSMEFGLHEALPLYAGGLGILAGDHLKTASDLGVPLVGVGILWQRGYFRQLLDAAGGQQELYPHNDPAHLPVQRVTTPAGDPLEVAIALPGRPLRLRAWQADVGRTRLLLLDTNHPLNAAVDRGITGSLYGADPEVRLLQELVIGIGGWRLLEALGLRADVCHLNEGHAAFVVVERARSFMRDHGVSFREALWATRAGNVFTTHTAVAAGFDVFGPSLIERYTVYFHAYVQELGITWHELLALGRRDPDDDGEPFAMAYLALRGSGRINAVCRLHGDVSRELFRGLFPRWPVRDVPITHVTNGVHVPSWHSPAADALWTAAPDDERWTEEVEQLGPRIDGRGDAELWALRTSERAALVAWVRGRLRTQLAQHGLASDALDEAARTLDPGALTLGFARRFTSYKRPDLLLADGDRLRRLLTREDRPVQIVLAGKAHPADAEGKRSIAEWVRFAEGADVRHRVVFLEDYDMTVAKALVAGVDVWLNTPRRPWEACGTSGMKVLVNGGLNLSELDGWWAEAYAPDRGWAVGDGREHAEPEWDAVEADALYRVLESEVVPCFYDRDATGVPRGWLRRVRASMRELAPRFGSGPMLREYVERLYLPAAGAYRARAADGAWEARALARWEARIAAGWADVRVGRVIADSRPDGVGVAVQVWLGGLAPADVRVELVADPVPGHGPVAEPMRLDAREGGDVGARWFTASIATSRPASHFTPRVVPSHPGATLPLELPLIRWP